MILSALTQLYERLSAQIDLTSGEYKVPPYGYSEQKINYILVLTSKGQLVDVIPNLTDEKKPSGKFVSVPSPKKRTSGIAANFLWDKSAYVLGVKSAADSKKQKKSSVERPPADSTWESTPLEFDAFRKLHVEKIGDSNCTQLQALKNFLVNWRDSQFGDKPCVPEMLDANLIFKVQGVNGFIHESPAAKDLWSQQVEPDELTFFGKCLVSGKNSAIARVHPSIKGIRGGKSSGGSIVSFNAEAYLSYGKGQGNNAPISEASAFAYTTALNFLLRRENKKCIAVGETSTVFWAIAEDPNEAEQAEQSFGFFADIPANDDSESTQLNPIIEKIGKGISLKDAARDIAPSTRFYILGLSPNAARISVRFWLDTTFGNLIENYEVHFADLAIEPNPWRTPPSAWQLLIATAPRHQKERAESKDISPLLAGELMRSIITGNRYPQTLLTQVINRIRNDGDVSGTRAALIRAVIHRDFRKNLNDKDAPMALDENNIEVSYQLGRLFAVLQRIQKAALGDNINAPITDRYYAAASTVPYSVFPRLLASSNNHLSKIRKEMPGYAVSLIKDVARIVDRLPSEFPKHFSIQDQGRFAIGYYHQNQKYFTKKSDETPIETPETSET